jgi:flagellin
MAMNSVNTNSGALVALQSLNRTNDEMSITQKRISTGLRVADAKDDGAAFAVAQKVRSDMSGLTSANEQLGGVKGIVDTTLSSLGKMSSTMNDIRATLTKLADTNISATSDERKQYTAQLKAQITQVNNFITDATYNGQNMLGGAPSTATAGVDITTIRNESAGTYTIKGALAGSNAGAAIATSMTLDDGNAAHSGILAAASLTAEDAKYLLGDATATPTLTAANLTTFSQAQTNINNLLNALGADSKYVDAQITYNKEKMDALEGGLGSLVDADLAKESARMQSLQIRQ